MATNHLGHEQENLTEIYCLVHSFLVAHAHVKAAKAVRKAAKEVQIEGIKKASHTTLESVLREWQHNKTDVESLKAEVQALTENLASMRAQSTATQAKSSSSESSGKSSSDGSSSESSGDGEEDKKSSDSSSSGDEEGEGGEEDEDEEPTSRPGIGARSHRPLVQASPVKVVANSLLQPPTTVSPRVNGKNTQHSGDSEDPADSKVTKKRKTNEGSVPTAIAIADAEAKSNEGNGSNPTKGKTNPGRKPTVTFERIKTNKVVYADERLKDNTFESRGVGTNDYGAKASADLIVTRGAGFRKEKNKKKRGSYRGGDITMESHSVKFND